LEHYVVSALLRAIIACAGAVAAEFGTVGRK
jgi:hypothetical protein